MNRIRIFITLILSAFLFFACTGPIGPQGPEGAQGPEGDPGNTNVNMKVYTGHITGLDYSKTNNALYLLYQADNVLHAEVLFSQDEIDWEDLETYINWLALLGKIPLSDVASIKDYSPRIGIATNAVVITITDLKQNLIGTWYKIVCYL